MKLRAFLFSLIILTGVVWVVGQDPQPALASRQACNPAIATVSGTSNVFGRSRSASGGPGSDVSNFPPIERTNIGPLDMTPGMSYRGGGVWQDDSGNRLQLSITATRNPQSGGSLGGACQSAFLQQSSRHDVPEAEPTVIQSSTTEVRYTVGYELYNTNGTGAGQTYYLQVATSVVPATAPALTAPSLNVTNPCNGTNSVFTLNWNNTGATSYALFQNGSQYGTVGGNVTTSTTGRANPGQTYTYRVEAIYPTGRAASNSVTITAQDCAPQQPVGSITLTNVTSACGTHAISWTTSNIPSGAAILVIRNGSGWATVVTNSYNTTATGTSSYQIRIGSVLSNTISVTATSCAAQGPGPFTVGATSTCIAGASPSVRISLTWTPSANANRYYVNGQDVGVVTSYQITRTTASNPPIRVQASVVSPTANNAINGTPNGTTAIPATDPSGLGGTGYFSVADFNAVATDCFAQPQVPGQFAGSGGVSCVGNTATAVLRWGDSARATSYRIYDLTNGPGQRLLGTVAAPTGVFVPDQNTFTTTDLPHSAGQQLQFTIQAVNTAGATSLQIPSSIVMPDCAPAPTITWQTTNTGCTNGSPYVALAWTPSSGLTSFTVLRDGAELATGITNAFYTDQTASPGAHTYKVTSGSTESADRSVTVSACPLAPNAPQLTVVAECSTTTPLNRVSWTSGVDTNRAVNSYQLVRTPGNTQTIAGGTLAYTDSQVTTGTQYAYRITATNAVGATASNEVTVTAADCAIPNNPPVATDDTAATGKDTPVTINVLANDSDPDGNLDPACLAVTVQPGHGTVTLTSDHRALYTPAAGYVGTDTFTYSICDEDDASDTAVVTITVNETNRPPVANDDTATTPQATPVTIDILANDSDPDDNLDPTTVDVITDPQHGTVVIANSDHTAVYTPAADFSGTDTFQYEVCDTTGACDQATVTITVTPVVVTPPPAEFTLSVQALCAGTSPQNVLTWSTSNNATSYSVHRGTQTLVASQTERSYTDTTAVTGTSYVYTVVASNSAASTNSNSVTLPTANCAPVVNNLPPQANDDAAATDQGSFVVIPVLTNDTDSDGTIVPSCTAVVTAPAHGTAVVDTTNGNIAYTPAAGFSGTDTFVYEICDDDGATDTATVTVTVRPPTPEPGPQNQPPRANDDAGTTPHNTPTTIDVLLNDADPDGNIDPTCVEITAQPGHGTVSVDEQTGRITYTPAAGFSGTDTFRYTVCDTNDAVSNEATVSVAVGQAPPAALASTGIPIIGFFVELWNRLLALIGLR